MTMTLTGTVLHIVIDRFQALIDIVTGVGAHVDGIEMVTARLAVAPLGDVAIVSLAAGNVVGGIGLIAHHLACGVRIAGVMGRIGVESFGALAVHLGAVVNALLLVNCGLPGGVLGFARRVLLPGCVDLVTGDDGHRTRSSDDFIDL
jgi:hypothetical protein